MIHGRLMRISLLVQDPSAKEVTYALEAIAAAAEGALRGQVMFAFATVDGVDLLLNHENIRMLTRVDP